MIAFLSSYSSIARAADGTNMLNGNNGRFQHHIQQWWKFPLSGRWIEKYTMLTFHSSYTMFARAAEKPVV